MIIDLLCLGPGGRFSKVSIINEPEKLQFQIEVSIVEN